MGTSRIVHYYRKTETLHSLLPFICEDLSLRGYGEESKQLLAVETENCFNVQIDSDTELSEKQQKRLQWLLAETFDDPTLSLLIEKSHFDSDNSNSRCYWILEFGPRLTFTSAFSSNASGICMQCGLPIKRLELSRRYRFHLDPSASLSVEVAQIVKSILHDRMTEQEYLKPLVNFESGCTPAPVCTIPVLSHGRPALEKLNNEMGLGFDDFDLDYYTQLFKVR
jgi:phosphoribosylformylglycinamidine synthase